MGANLLGLLILSISIALIQQCEGGSMKVKGSFSVETDDEDTSLTLKLDAHSRESDKKTLPNDQGFKPDMSPPGISHDEWLKSFEDPSGENGPENSPGISGVKGQPGEKGEMGYPGLNGRIGIPGPQGYEGMTGQKGEPGYCTLDCARGEKGDKGSKGRIGEFGITGIKGEMGAPGIMGPFGMKGFKGDKGDSIVGPPGITGLVGDKGDTGFPGPPGIPGICECTPKGTEDTENTNYWISYLQGSLLSPAPVTCKSAPSDLESGFYYFNQKDAFKAYCNMATKTTCLTQDSVDNSEEPTDYSDKSKPFWLSTLKNTVEDIYGLSKSNIEWLQKQSGSVSMILRYHCKNSSPLRGGDDLSQVLKLLTWNDIVIAPFPTSTSPFYYSVHIETDGCQNSNGSDWRYTDIILSTKFVNRLPIKDYYISDIRGVENQSFKIELISLCFK